MSKSEIIIKTSDTTIERLIEYANELQEIGERYAINPFHPGLIKELKIAKILGHSVIYGSKDSDAIDSKGNHYEYITSLKGGYMQIDDIYKDDADDIEQHLKHLRSIENIRKNKSYYFAYIKGIEPIEIYEIPTDVLVEEILRQLQKSKITVSHINIPEKWIMDKAKLKYRKPDKEKHSWWWHLWN